MKFLLIFQQSRATKHKPVSPASAPQHLWQFKFWVKSLTVLSLFEWIQQKQGILSGSFSHLLYPPSCDLEIYLSVSSQKVSKWHLERKRDATGQVCRLQRSVHLCPSNSCWEPIRWWDTRKVRVRYMWILFILCHLDERLINIMKTRLQSKGVEVLLSARCFDSSLLLRFPRFLHSHLRLDRLKRKERKRGKEVRVWKLRNEKSKCN